MSNHAPFLPELMVVGLIIYAVALYLEPPVSEWLPDKAQSESYEPDTVACENCGKQRYTFERCNHCGHVHWK